MAMYVLWVATEQALSISAPGTRTCTLWYERLVGVHVLACGSVRALFCMLVREVVPVLVRGRVCVTVACACVGCGLCDRMAPLAR